MIKRIDPDGCGCTDCITGYSKPANECNYLEILACKDGYIENASGKKIKVSVELVDE